MMGLTFSFALLVTIPTFDCVVSVARTDNHIYESEASIDQCWLML